MKLLLGILLALVLFEGVAIVGLYVKLDRQPNALITRAEPPTPVEAAPYTRPVADPSANQSQRFEEFTANLDALRAEVESLRAAVSRQQVQESPSTPVDLQAEAFKSSVRELSVQALHDEEEKRLLLEFQEKAPELAAHLAGKWPVRFGTIEDLQRVILDWYPRSRALNLKYTPRGQMLKESDPNYAEWIREDSAIDAWATAELERLYGAPLDRELVGRAWSLIFGYASRVK
jgi:hypothetical protein